MPKYAWIGPDNHVIGWFDTDMHRYDLPPIDQLLEVSNEDWERRMQDPSRWQVKDGRLAFGAHRPAPQ